MKAAAILACLLGSAGSVLGWSSSSQRCEVCNTQTSYISDSSTHSRTITIPEFTSQSGNWEMYLRVDLAHTYLYDLTMTLKQDSGSTMTVWNKECGGSNDLGAIFYDSATSTVYNQGKCSYSRSNIVYARPYQYFSTRSIGDTPTGTYYFTLSDTVGDESGCVFENEPQETPEIVANSSSCEICTEESNSFRKQDTVKYQFNVTDFESLSNDSDFYVSVDIDHNYLGSLEMKLKDEDSGNEVYLWNNECGSSNDLNVSFSDIFNGTVADMDSCSSAGYRRLYAQPFQSLGSIGDYPNGSYTFTLEEKDNQDGGTINRVCLGWYDEVGCSVNGTIASQLPEYVSSDSPRCEICDNTRQYFQSGGGIDRLFTVTDFESQSGVNRFFVSVQVDHTYIGGLEMLIEDSTNTTSSVFLWNNECGSADDLNVTFSDIFNDTVIGQSRCYAGLNTPLFAQPYQSLGQIGLNQTGQYLFTLSEVYNYYSGYLNRVCVGWYDLEGCTVSGTVSSLADIPKCEICDNDRVYVSSYSSIAREFNIHTFESESGQSDFFVSVQLDHNYMGSLDMVLESSQNGSSIYLWNNECGSRDDLNVTFSDRFSRTVSSQGRCSGGVSSPVYARPYQLFGNIGQNKTGAFTFTLRDTYGYYSYLNRVCVGWLDSQGCSVTGNVIKPLGSSSPKCEICDYRYDYVPAYSSLTSNFSITGFQSDSGESEFYVLVRLDHNYLGRVEMTLKDGDSGMTRYLWKDECSYSDDLYVYFSDVYSQTVAAQSRCSSSYYTQVYAKPFESFGSVGDSQTGEYSFTLQNDYYYSGYLSRVCVGWYDKEGCSVTGTVSRDDGPVTTTEEPGSQYTRCEICDNTRRSFSAGGRLTRQFSVNTFQSQSDNPEFFVSVAVDHDTMGGLDMKLEKNDNGNKLDIWDNECGNNADLNATFSDRFDETVEDQSECGEGLSTRVYAAPHESFGSIGDTQTGTYTFILRERSNYQTGYVNSVCIGWFDSEGCSINGGNSNIQKPQRCQICDSDRRYFDSDEDLEVGFNVNSFQSDSGQSSFFVSVNLEHSDLSLLDLTVWDEMDEYTAYGSSFLYEDCEGHSELNATFSNIFGQSVEEQGGCSAGLNTEVFARPKYRFGRYIGNQTSGGFSVSVSLDDDADEGGYLNEVCIGWYTTSQSDNCQIDASATSSGRNRNNGNNDGDNVAIIVGSVAGSIVGCLMCVALVFFLYNLKGKRDFENRRIPAMNHAAVASLDSVDMAADEMGATSSDFTAGAGATTTSGVQLAEVAFEGDVTTAPEVTAAQASDAPPLYTDGVAGEMVATNGPVNPDAPPVYGNW